MFKVFNFFVQLYSFFQYYSIQFERKYWHPFLLNYFGEPVEEVTVAYVKEGIKIGDATDEIHDYDFIVYKKGIFVSKRIFLKFFGTLNHIKKNHIKIQKDIMKNKLPTNKEFIAKFIKTIDEYE